MKKRMKSKKLISSLAISTLVLGLFVTTVINADETEVTSEPEIQEVDETTNDAVVEENEEIAEDNDEVVNSEITTVSETEQIDRSNLARADLTANAFSESSRPLEQAIIAKYDGNNGTAKVDTDGNGYISVGEANSFGGNTIDLQNKQLVGTMDGVENFTSILHLHLGYNQLEGNLPENIGQMSSLLYIQLQGNNLSGDVPASIGNLNSLLILNIYQNQELSGTIPSTLGDTLQILNYRATSIETVDLSDFNALTSLGTTNATNANLSKVKDFVTGVNINNTSYVQVTGDAGMMSWDSTTGYYVINPNFGAKYRVHVVFLTETGEAHIRPSAVIIDLQEGGLMDNAGNLIIGADLSNVVDGKVVLPYGGTVVTGETIYTFDDNTIISETNITTDGNAIMKKNTADSSGATMESIITEITSLTGEKISIDLTINGGTAVAGSGSVVTNDDGSKTYLVGGGTVTDAGVITSPDITVTVPLEKVGETETEGNKVIFPSGVVVDDGITSIIYPDTIIYDVDNDSLMYLPVDELLIDNGTNLAQGITQTDIDNAQSLVDSLADSNLKNELQEKVTTAQNMINAKDEVDNLFTDGTHTDIPDGLTQKDIDKAQELVNKVPDGALKDELQKEIDKAQDMLNARDKVDNLFTDGTHTDITDGLTQKDIDKAQDAVDKLPDGALKDELQKEIDKAQDMLDAKDKVDNLFNDKKDNLGDGVTQKDIDKAQDAVDKLPDGTLKDKLQKEIDRAQDMLNAKDAVNDLLDKDGNLNSGVTQEDIDNAQDLVNKLPDGELKDELQAMIDNAQKQLDEKNKNNPSTAPTIQKPSVDSGSTSSTSTVKTADTTNLSLYLGLLVISLAGIIVVKKRKDTVK